MCVRDQATVRFIAMDIFESKEKGDLPLQRGDVSGHILFPVCIYLARISVRCGETSDMLFMCSWSMRVRHTTQNGSMLSW